MPPIVVFGVNRESECKNTLKAVDGTLPIINVIVVRVLIAAPVELF